MNTTALKKIYTTILLLIVFSPVAFAQNKESYNWIFGFGAWMTWNTTQTIGGLSGLPTPISGANIYQSEGSFSMSDTNGNLMFYSDGISIWNKNHTIMPNGSNLTGNSDAAQSGIVIPYPGKSNQFIAFTIGARGSDNLSYSVVDMTLESGLGDIVSGQKNIALTGHVSILGENIATVKMTSGSGYWLIAAGRGTSSSINVWKVTSAGVETSCFASYTLPQDISTSSTEAYIRFSPDGKYFALPTYLSGNQVFFGEFDPHTGTFPSIKVLTGYPGYGVEFSPSGKLLYVSESHAQRIRCYKFADLLASAAPNSEAYCMITVNSTNSFAAYPLQLGPDGRIYSTIHMEAGMIVIDNVDDYGNSTAHVVSGLLPSGATGAIGLPTFPSYFFAPVESTCPYFTDDIWYFGNEGAGIAFNQNENGDKVAVSASGESKVASNENSLSVSSPGCGSSLIFYSQHNQLYNAKHQLMLNGSFSGNTSVADGLAACYIGDNKYMLFSVTDCYNSGPMALECHIIDMNEDNGYGKRISTTTIEASGMSESIELVPVPNTSNEYWLIYSMYNANEVRVRKVTGSTVSSSITSTLPMAAYGITNALSYTFRANATYNMLGLAYGSAQRLAIFDFDTNTGNISVNKIATLPFGVGYGVEFSPNGKYVYCATWTTPSQITQYDIANNTFTAPFAYGGTQGGGLKIGPDGKLYVRRAGQYMGVIANPDAPLTVAGYTQNGFDLGNGINSTGLAFSTGLTPPAICPSGLNQAPVAVNDTATVFINGVTTCIPVMANDYDPNPGDSLSLVNVFFLNETDTSILNVSFNLGDSTICVTPKAAAQEGDVVTLMYTIRDDANPIRLCADAKVTITMINYPDNIIDADCYITPPGTNFSIKELMVSNAADVVYSCAVPLVGDIDNDGYTEIVVAGGAYPNGYTSTLLHIFKVKNNQLTLQQTITTPAFFGGIGAPYSIAKVDGNDYAAIFLCTRDSRELVKYVYNGTSYSEQGRVSYSSGKHGGVPYITDFNGDGRAEVLVYDKVFDAKTLTLLVDGGLLGASGMGFGEGGFISTNYASFMAVADLDGDGLPEVAGGNSVYKINITNTSGTSGNSFTLWSKCDGTGPGGEAHGDAVDGATAVADMDGDGLLDVIVTVTGANNTLSSLGSAYIWNPRTKKVMHTNIINNISVSGSSGPSAPFVGDIDNDGEPEICFTGAAKMYAFDYDKSAKTLNLKWQQTTSDNSASTTMSMFDFNQDGYTELVYRDETHLRIINGVTGQNITTFAVTSGTYNEYPVVADVNGDGAAEIIVTGCTSGHINGRLWVYSSDPAGTWAPARKVWNQFQYNAVNVNEDLTIPKYQLNPATVFPGADGVLGTTDDIRPYNAFLQQQTILDKNGSPVWLTPDVYSNSSLVSTSVSNKSVTINVGIVNQGDAAIGPPVYVTIYKNTIAAANKIMTGNANIQINPGDTGLVSLTIPDITLINPVSIIIRINDDGTKFPYQPECDETNNEITILNPAINLMMQKNATLEGVPHNGTYENPVAALYSEIIEYTITAVNANAGIGKVIIRDTLPPYLDFVSSNPVVIPAASGTTPQRDALEWTIAGVASMATTSVTVKATPQEGSSASQSMFINRAWVTVSDTITVPTNSTFHQGASIGMATFSAGFGGNIYNAGEQALDYRTSPRSGIVIVPDEGYRFAGWSHEEYVSLRGKTIQAEERIMLYDTLTVYGDIELKANFELEEFPIEYHLNGAVNAGDNPPAYTIESGAITLGAPEKAGDVFTGWTGSNGDTPQLEVNISKGSTGELEFYANFLRSGREDDTQLRNPEKDKIWAAKDELYIRTSKPGSVVRIYSTEGVLQKQQTILQAGEMKIKLARGIYVVTLNNNIGQIAKIE